ncbi:Pycsar system effector family protein [Streptomyces sp. NPDC058595]|uniref:Pycsar system effector family protein n=1 Tax=Streptomyces sp. NPDC058595 TaxID=3346550 RepID=UPI003654908C
MDEGTPTTVNGTSPAHGPGYDYDKQLDAACAEVSGQIARTDSKASLLLAFDGAVLAGLASVADKDLPLVTQVVGGVAVAFLALAAWLLLLVVRPNLGGGNRTVREGFPCWARMEESALRRAMTEDTRIARVKALSGIAVRKFQLLTRAVDIIRAALALLALATAGTAL